MIRSLLFPSAQYPCSKWWEIRITSTICWSPNPITPPARLSISLTEAGSSLDSPMFASTLFGSLVRSSDEPILRRITPTANPLVVTWSPLSLSCPILRVPRIPAFVGASTLRRQQQHPTTTIRTVPRSLPSVTFSAAPCCVKPEPTAPWPFAKVS